MKFTKKIETLFCCLLILSAFQTTSVIGQSENLKNLTYIQSILPKNYEEIWLKSTIKQILKNESLSGATFWQQSASVAIGSFVIREFTKHMPVYIMNSKCFKNDNDYNRSLPVMIKYPKNLISVLILHHLKKSERILKNDIKNTLETLTIRMIARDTCLPKVLIIILGTVRNRLLEEVLQQSYQECQLKYIDMTIILVHENHKLTPQIVYYEMFQKNLFHEN